jgi:hypothetical protein
LDLALVIRKRRGDGGPTDRIGIAPGKTELGVIEDVEKLIPERTWCNSVMWKVFTAEKSTFT